MAALTDGSPTTYATAKAASPANSPASRPLTRKSRAEIMTQLSGRGSRASGGHHEPTHELPSPRRWRSHPAQRTQSTRRLETALLRRSATAAPDRKRKVALQSRQ